MQGHIERVVLEVGENKVCFKGKCALIQNRELLLGQNYEICFGSEKYLLA